MLGRTTHRHALLAAFCLAGKRNAPVRRAAALVFGLGLVGMSFVGCQDNGPARTLSSRGVTYYNEHLSSGPWSVHVVKIDRQDASLQLHSVLGRAGRMGLKLLSEQAGAIPPTWGQAVAAVNGDFYTREGSAYAGDPRGLQIIDGELVSGPGDQAAFWIDESGEPRASNIVSQFRVTWPDGTVFPFGLNEEGGPSQMELCTSAVGEKTRHRTAGFELVLEKAGNGVWLPLRVGETYQAKVRVIHNGSGTPVTPDTVVLSVGKILAAQLPPPSIGTVLSFTTETTPTLKSARIAIGGGSVLVRNGKALRLEKPVGGRGLTSYSVSSMFERHPRSVIGWNKTHFFFGEVDGRQRKLSVGMTLEELAQYMTRLGCDVAMNLDGGGSSTLWYDGRVRNNPCDGAERPVANGLVVTRQATERPTASAAVHLNP